MDFDFLSAYPSVLLGATWLTIRLSLAALIGAGLIGLSVALVRVMVHPAISALIGIAVDIVRGTPLLVQLLIWYLGPSVVDIELAPFEAAVIALSINGAAFVSEIFRGALQAVPKGQREAALAVGLRRSYSLRAIELPQALPTAVPAMVSFYIGLIKDTSIALIVGLPELLRSAQFIADYERRPLEIYLVISVIYFALCFPLSKLAGRLEGRLGRSGLVQERMFL